VAAQPDALASAVALRALAYCRAAVGTPYIYGGDTTTGYDCSGLIYAAYGAAGHPVPRTSEEQWGDGDAQVAWGAWAPGDLVFSDWGDGQPSPGHVVIYAGDGWTIAAPHTGTTVQWEHVSTFAPPHYVGSTRPAPLKRGQQAPAQNDPTPGSADYDPTLAGGADAAGGGSGSAAGGSGSGLGAGSAALGGGVVILAGLLILALVGAGYLWWRGRNVQPDPTAPGGA
jgi:hypothetical protein